MPQTQFARDDYESRLRNQRTEQAVTDLSSQMTQLLERNKILEQELAAVKLSKIEADADLALKGLADEGYKIVPDVDKDHLCRLSREKWAGAIKFMRETRAKDTVKTLPNGGRAPLNPADLMKPVKMSMPTDGFSMPADPDIPMGASSAADTNNWDELLAIRGAAVAKGISLQHAFDAPAQNNGTSVAVR